MPRLDAPDSKQQPRTIPGSLACTVFTYPSIGGIVIRHFTGLELDWLGFPRTIAYTERPVTDSEEERSLDAEDAFALRMIQLSAR